MHKEWESNKASGPSGVDAEMLKSAPDIYYKIIADLMNAIKFQGKVPADWSDCITVSLFKGKEDALD